DRDAATADHIAAPEVLRRDAGLPVRELGDRLECVSRSPRLDVAEDGRAGADRRPTADVATAELDRVDLRCVRELVEHLLLPERARYAPPSPHAFLLYS